MGDGVDNLPEVSDVGDDASTMGPERFGDYVLERRLRTGGMAELFVAHRVDDPERSVALKRLLPCHAEDAEQLEMFRHEGELAGIFHHPGIVRSLDSGCIGDLPYLALQFVDGPSLAALMRAARVRKQSLPEYFACHVARRVLAALHHAHERADADGRSLGIVHRDITPGNILLCLDGEVKLCDFGLARSKLQRLRTRAGIAKGTHAYLSPEQTRLEELDRRTDLFSLGTVMYEMLTGRYLFRAKQDYTTIARIRRAEVPPLREVNPEVSPQVEAIVMRALSRDRADRFATAAEMERALLKAQLTSGHTCTLGQAADLLAKMRESWQQAERKSRELADRARARAVTGLHAFDNITPPSSMSELTELDEWADPIASDPVSQLPEPVASAEIEELSSQAARLEKPEPAAASAGPELAEPTSEIDEPVSVSSSAVVEMGPSEELGVAVLDEPESTSARELDEPGPADSLGPDAVAADVAGLLWEDREEAATDLHRRSALIEPAPGAERAAEAEDETRPTVPLPAPREDSTPTRSLPNRPRRVSQPARPVRVTPPAGVRVAQGAKPPVSVRVAQRAEAPAAPAQAASTTPQGPLAPAAATQDRLRIVTPPARPHALGNPSPFPSREDETPRTVPRAQAVTLPGGPANRPAPGRNLVLAGLAAAAIIGLALWSTRSDAPAVLYMTTTPRDANVLVDGRIVSTESPHRVTIEHSDRRRVLAVQHDGYQGWHTLMRLEPGQEMTLPPVELLPQPPALAGSPSPR